MELAEDQIFEKYAKHCGPCNRNTILPHEYEWTCFSSGYNVTKRNHELSKIRKMKINFINRLKYAEQNFFCICVDVYQIYEGDDFNKIYEALSTLKNKKFKMGNILIEKQKRMIDNQDFEQDYWSRTAKGMYKIGHDIVRILKWICYHDTSHY